MIQASMTPEEMEAQQVVHERKTKASKASDVGIVNSWSVVGFMNYLQCISTLFVQALGKATERIKAATSINKEKNIDGMSVPYIASIMPNLWNGSCVTLQQSSTEGRPPA